MTVIVPGLVVEQFYKVKKESNNERDSYCSWPGASFLFYKTVPIVSPASSTRVPPGALLDLLVLGEVMWVFFQQSTTRTSSPLHLSFLCFLFCVGRDPPDSSTAYPADEGGLFRFILFACVSVLFLVSFQGYFCFLFISCSVACFLLL